MNELIKKRRQIALFPEYCRPVPKRRYKFAVKGDVFRSIVGQFGKTKKAFSILSGALSATHLANRLFLFLAEGKMLKAKIYGWNNNRHEHN